MREKNKKEIEIIVRTIILVDGKILLCRQKGKDYYFFPGGHIDFGENAEQTIAREMKEELDSFSKNYSFIGAVENIYTENSQKHHEIILAFKVTIDNLKTQSRENHIEFFFKNEKELAEEKVLPIALTKAVLKWLKDKKPFWASWIYNKSKLKG